MKSKLVEDPQLNKYPSISLGKINNKQNKYAGRGETSPPVENPQNNEDTVRQRKNT